MSIPGNTTAVVNLFTPDGSLDDARAEALARWLVSSLKPTPIKPSSKL